MKFPQVVLIWSGLHTFGYHLSHLIYLFTFQNSVQIIFKLAGRLQAPTVQDKAIIK